MESLKETLTSFLSAPTTFAAGFIALFALLNFTSLPFVWHLRLFSAFIQQSETSSLNNAYDILDSSLYPHTPRVIRPVITSTRCSILEMDYALHKSNSTYFADLDISRVHLLLALFKKGLAKIQTEENLLPADQAEGQRGKKKKVMPVLGGASASFRRAIPPLGKYDVVTRVLCWDEKWIYIASWFVKPGSMSLSASVGKTGGYGSSDDLKGPPTAFVKHEHCRPLPIPKNVYATAFAKYVIKAGSVTVPPDRLMVASGLVPVGDYEQEAREVRAIIERERLHTLRYGKAFSELDGLHSEFDEHMQTIGFFKDLI